RVAFTKPTVPRPLLWQPSGLRERGPRESGPWSRRRVVLTPKYGGPRQQRTFLADGVTVAQQILVLFVQVRILVGQYLNLRRGRSSRSARGTRCGAPSRSSSAAAMVRGRGPRTLLFSRATAR